MRTATNLFASEKQRRAFDTLPGLVHEIGKSVVIFTHPRKVAIQELESAVIAGGDREQLERLKKTHIFGVAFLPYSRRDLSGERSQFLRAYLLPVPWWEIGTVGHWLRPRKGRKKATSDQIGWAMGRTEAMTLMPFCSRDRLMDFLRGECPGCHEKHYQDLLALSQPKSSEDFLGETVSHA